MAVSQYFAVTIEFASAAPFLGGAQLDRVGVTREIRLVENRTKISRNFTLYDGDMPEYTLSLIETRRLDQLLGELIVKTPWQGSAGFDGVDCELTLLGAMSSVTFRWWVKAPEEWEQVGAVFDYVLAVADHCRDEGN